MKGTREYCPNPRPSRRTLLAAGLGALGVADTAPAAWAANAASTPVGGAALPQAGGIVAASSLIDTGFGFGYFPVQHVGATSWYLMAALGANPYQSGGLGHH